MLQHGVIVHQLCRPVWRRGWSRRYWPGESKLPGFVRDPPCVPPAKWIPQGWQWVDPQKEFNAMKLAIRAGLSRSEAISSFGYDAEDIDREIAADNARADALGLRLRLRPAVRPGRCSRNRCRAKRAVRGCQRSDYERLRSR
jgi:capsid protein